MPPRSAKKTAVAKRRTRASAKTKLASKPSPSPEAAEEVTNGGGAVRASVEETAEEVLVEVEVSPLMSSVEEVKPLVSEPDEGFAVVGVTGQEEVAPMQALEDSVMEEASGRDEGIAVVGEIGLEEEASQQALEEPVVEEASGRDEVAAQAENELVAEEEEDDPSMVEEEAAPDGEEKEDEEDPVEVEEEAAPVGEKKEDEEDPVEAEEDAVQDGEQKDEGDEDPSEVEEEIALDGEGEEEEEPLEDPKSTDPADEDVEEVAQKKPMVGGSDSATGGDAVKNQGVDGLNDDGDSGSDDDDAENEEVDPSLYMHEERLERKKKEVDIFIGGLAKDAVEDDIIKVFGVFGEIQSVRIVKSQTTQKSKGFAFIRYATVEAAKKALTELKDGTEVKGKRVGISASQDNDTLYLGNICKSWSKDQVVETLKGFGVEGVEHLLLPDDPNNEGKSKGFAFLEFSSHSDAMAAFQRLRKPDAVLGCDRSAKVSFAQTPINPSEELLLQVKTVYIENVPASWDESTVKGFCEEYGKIEKVQVFRKNHTGKKKEFAFVDFASRESALVCVEGINNSHIGEGDVKVSANLAKPLNKGRLAKQGIRGGFKVRKDGEATKKTIQPKNLDNKKSKAVLIKENAYPKKFGNKPSSFQSKGIKRKNGTQMAKPIIRDKKHGRKGPDNFKERPLKKSRRNHDFRPRPSKGFGNQRVGYAGHTTVHPTVHMPRYATNATSYSGYGHAGASGSNLRHSDLEPHAGYLPSRNIPTNYGYEQRRPSAYISHQRGGAAFAGAAPTVTQTSYPGYTNYAGYQAGYAYPPPPSGAYPGSSGPYPPRRAYY